MFYYTYVLKNEKDGKLYIGWTDDLKHRVLMHNNGLVPATKNRQPLILEYYEARKDKAKAIKREKHLKAGFGRRFLKDRLTPP